MHHAPGIGRSGREDNMLTKRTKTVDLLGFSSVYLPFCTHVWGPDKPQCPLHKINWKNLNKHKITRIFENIGVGGQCIAPEQRLNPVLYFSLSSCRVRKFFEA